MNDVNNKSCLFLGIDGPELPPPDTNLEGNVPPHSTVKSVYLLTNHEIVVEQSKKPKESPKKCQIGWHS